MYHLFDLVSTADVFQKTVRNIVELLHVFSFPRRTSNAAIVKIFSFAKAMYHMR